MFIKLLDCGSTDQLENGKVMLGLDSRTTVGALAIVTCNTGYDASKMSIRCLPTGKWEKATCVVKDCGSTDQLENGKVMLGLDSRTTVGALAIVTCNTGYDASKMSIRCLPTGKWEIATCVVKDCGKPPTVRYGSISLKDNSQSTYNSTAKITCQEGYNAMKQVIICQETGIWESSHCEPKAADADDTSVILTAVLVPILSIGLIILLVFVLWKYRRQGWSIWNSSTQQDLVSFKHEEDLQEDNRYVNMNLSVINEQAWSENQQSQDTNVEESTGQVLDVIPRDDLNADDTNEGMLPEKQHVFVSTGEELQDKQQSQASKVSINNVEVLPENRQGLESDAASKNEIVVPQIQQDQNVIAAEQNVDMLSETRQVQDSNGAEKPNAEQLGNKKGLDTIASDKRKDDLPTEIGQDLNVVGKTGDEMQDNQFNVEVLPENLQGQESDATSKNAIVVPQIQQDQNLVAAEQNVDMLSGNQQDQDSDGAEKSNAERVIEYT